MRARPSQILFSGLAAALLPRGQKERIIVQPSTAIDQSNTIGAKPWHPNLVFGLLLCYFALFGITFGAQGVIWADMMAALRLTEGVFGTAQLSAPLISVVILLQAGPLCAVFGKKRLALIGVVVLGIALLWMSSVGGLWGLVGALLISGIGFGSIETAMNAATLDWEQATGRQVMNLMHAGFSGGAVIGALGAGAMLGAGLAYPQVFQVLAVICLLVVLASLPVRFPVVTAAAEQESGPGAALRFLFSRATLAILAVLCLISTLGESVANIWAVIHLRELGAPVVIGGAAFALFNGTMFIGRLANASIVARFGERFSLIASGVCTLLAGLILFMVASVWPVVAAFALLGLGVAGVIPTVLSAAARLAPGNSAAVTGGIMSVAYVSFIIAPPLIGWAAELFSLRAAFVIVALTGALLIGLARNIVIE